MPTAQEALETALACHRAGQFQQAELIYRRILEVLPHHSEVIHLLGVVLHQQGRDDRAIECFEQAARLDPSQARFHNNLGELYRRQGRFSDAVACFQRSLQLQPGYPEAHNNLGIAWTNLSDFQEAAACFSRAIALKPDYPAALNNLGLAQFGLGRSDEAIPSFQRALKIDPNYAEAHNNLGIAWAKRGDLQQATACFQRAIELKPDCAEAFHGLGTAWKDLANLDEAVACYRRAIDLRPDYAEAYSSLGNALLDQGRIEDAAASCRRAIEIRPDLAAAQNNLGNALAGQGRLDEAIACYQRAIDLEPQLADAHNNLGNAWGDRGELDRAIPCFQQAILLKPDFVEARSNLLSLLQYRPGVTLSELAAAHAEYEQRHAAPLRSSWRQHENDRSPERPLRLGFVSPDFCRHPVGYFLIRVLENLARQECEAISYSDRLKPDDMTARLRAASALWRDVARLNDEQLAHQIRADRIDILFDLAGHTARNRLLVFARRPAPIQVTWMGYVGTTGLAAMDYILADQHEIPPESEPFYCERTLRLPNGYVCFEPPAHASPVGPLPALSAGRVTLGSFNNPAKITRDVIACWARILVRLPEARLILKYRGFGDRTTQDRFRALFAEPGVDTRRIEMLGPSPHTELLACYHQIDLALDPFPYNGGLTTCEALWMGVPVVTCPGETFAGRHSLSHLSNVGLTDTIAASLDEYVDLAVALAQDLPRLATLRAGLRHRVEQSPLCDGKQFAVNFLEIVRRVWREWVDRGDEDPPETSPLPLRERGRGCGGARS